MEYIPATAEQISSDAGLADWRVILKTIQTDFAAPSYPAAAALVVAIAEAAERLVHHPDIDVRYPGRVRVVISTHATGGLTTLDVELAKEISRLAAAHGATADTTSLSAFEVAIDTMDAARIRPFWKALLGYEERNGTLVDPQGKGPDFWFQQMDEPRTQRQRFHIDVDVPHDEAEERIAKAIAAGGRLVTDSHARAWWVLADADGNEACICTWQDRG